MKKIYEGHLGHVVEGFATLKGLETSKVLTRRVTSKEWIGKQKAEGRPVEGLLQ